MNRAKYILTITALLLVAATAGYLLRLKYNQRLGEPGVKVTRVAGAGESGLVIDLPVAVPGYESEAVPADPIELKVLPRDTTIGRRKYTAEDGFTLYLTVVLMGSDRTSIHKPQYCLAGQGWKIIHSEPISVGIGGKQPFSLPVMKLTTAKQVEGPDGKAGVGHGLYLYWFVADGYLTEHHSTRMWWMARELLRSGTLQRWAYVTCQVICPPGAEAASLARMEEFLARAVPQFQTTPGPATSELAATKFKMALPAPAQ